MGAALVLVVGASTACFELSGPPSGLSGISPIQADWPSVVVGDALRNVDGDTAALRVDAFDGDGNFVEDADVRFIVLDRGLHVTSAGVVIGDSVRTSPVRIVAQVQRQGDVLQTPELSIDVVPLPDSVAPAADTVFADTLISAFDATPFTFKPLEVKILSKGSGTAAAAPVKSWIVRYEIIAEPAGVGGQHTAVFAATGTGSVTDARAAFDTTDATGTASRAITLRRALLARGVGRDEVRVRVTVWRIGPASETRTVTFTLPFVGQ